MKFNRRVGRDAETGAGVLYDGVDLSDRKEELALAKKRLRREKAAGGN